MKCLAIALALIGVVVSASLGEDWEAFLHSNNVTAIWVGETYCYWGSAGGVVIHEISTGKSGKIAKSVGGLRSNDVTGVAEDGKGRLWIGTRADGVSVLLDDGSWEFHSTRDLDLPQDEVTCIATRGDLTVVGTSEGVSLFDDGRLVSLFVGSDWGHWECSSVLDVALDDTLMLVGTECGLFTYSLAGRVWKTLIYGRPAQSLDYDEDRLFWIVTSDSIYTYDGTGLELISKQFIRPDVIHDIGVSDSVVWVATSNGPSRYNFSSASWRRNKEGLPSDLWNSRVLAVSADSTVWMGTKRGMAVLSDSVWQVRVSEGPAGNYVEDLEVDANGTVWCATGQRGGVSGDVDIGILRFDGLTWEHLTSASSPPDSIPSNQAYCLDSNPVDGSVWVGFWSTGAGDLLRYDIHTGEWTSHRPILRYRVVADVYVDQKGNVVFAEYTVGLGVLCADGGVVHYSRGEDSDCLNTICVTAIGPGPGGSYMFGDFCTGEIDRIEPGADCSDKQDDTCGQRWTSRDGLVGGFAYDVEMDPFGVVWLATSGGLSAYDGEWHAVHKTMGVVWDIEIDSQGTKWVACEQGLFALKGYGTEWEDFSDDYERYDSSNSPLPPVPLKALGFDADGALWVGTAGGGIYRFDRPVSKVEQKAWVDAVPNPYVEDAPMYDADGKFIGYADEIEFRGFMPGSRILIYTIAGELVADFGAEAGWPKETMQKNGTVSGIYIYRAYAEDGHEFVGRIAIIR